MRALLTLLSIFSVSLLWCADDPTATAQRYEQAVRTAHEFLFHKEIRLSGVKDEVRTKLLNELPHDRSVPWWMFNQSAVGASIIGDPQIERAEVKRCALTSWSCFEIEITERRPAAAVEFGDKLWLVGHDGVMLERRDLRNMDFSLPLIQGEEFGSMSPDLLKAKLSQVLNAIKVLSEATHTEVAGVRIEDRAEISVWFRDFSPRVIFELGAAEGWEQELKDRGERLVALRASLGEKASEVRSIDLAYQKLGVVRLKNEVK